MAKPKSPNSKKNTEPRPTVSTTISPPPLPTNGSTAAATAPAIEASVETKGTTKNESSAKTATRKTARKPEVAKSETRANLVPTGMEDEVRQLAYLLAERRGFESGHETEDWLAAENEVRQRYRQHSA